MDPVIDGGARVAEVAEAGRGDARDGTTAEAEQRFRDEREQLTETIVALRVRLEAVDDRR